MPMVYKPTNITGGHHLVSHGLILDDLGPGDHPSVLGSHLRSLWRGPMWAAASENWDCHRAVMGHGYFDVARVFKKYVIFHGKLSNYQAYLQFLF